MTSDIVMAICQELATGALPLAIVKMGTMDRDDKGDKRIPVLMNYLSAFRFTLSSDFLTRGWL